MAGTDGGTWQKVSLQEALEHARTRRVVGETEWEHPTVSWEGGLGVLMDDGTKVVVVCVWSPDHGDVEAMPRFWIWTP